MIRTTTALLALLLASLTACVEQRTRGVQCFSALDCQAHEHCAIDSGSCALGPGPAICPLWTDPTAWPQVVVVGHREGQSGDVMEPTPVVELALAAMGDRAPAWRSAKAGPATESMLAGWPTDSPPVVIGPYTIGTVQSLRAAAATIGALVLSLRAEEDRRWAMSPRSTDLARWIGEVVRSLPIEGRIVVVQRPRTGLGNAIAAVLGPGRLVIQTMDEGSFSAWPPDGDPALDEAELVIFEALEVDAARHVLRTVLNMAQPPPLLMIESYPDASVYGELLKGLPRPEALCGVRALTTGPGAVQVTAGSGDDGPPNRRDADEARLYDAVMLAGLLVDVAGADRPSAAGDWDLLLARLLRSEQASAPHALDGPGWAEAARRLREGEDGGVRLQGASAVSIPDHAIRRPKPNEVWLRRLEARGPGPGEDRDGSPSRAPNADRDPVTTTHSNRVVHKGVFDTAAFQRAWLAGDCDED